MTYIFYLILGLVIGSLATFAIIRVHSGDGCFKLEKIEGEEGFYKVNVRLIPDQNLDKKKFILLTRE